MKNFAQRLRRGDCAGDGCNYNIQPEQAATGFFVGREESWTG
ncbi:hypothetical protein OFN43_31600 [Escherichia coli]|nr:hypothetical protein [Escherichia coli]